MPKNKLARTPRASQRELDLLRSNVDKQFESLESKLDKTFNVLPMDTAGSARQRPSATCTAIRPVVSSHDLLGDHMSDNSSHKQQAILIDSDSENEDSRF